MSVSTKDKLKELFDNFMHLLKYIVVFILYVFAFNYMYVNNTVPISFILLLFLHVSIIGLVRSDLRTLAERYDFTTLYSVGGSILGLLVFLGPFLCWVMVFIAILLIISMFSDVKFYSNVGEKVDLGEMETFELSVVKILLILSSVIFAIIYGFIYSGLLKNPLREMVPLNKDDNNLIPRLIITTILLISFVVYFLLVNASNITIVLGISFVICLYFINFLYAQFKNKYIDFILGVIYTLSVVAIFVGLVYLCYVKSIEHIYALIPSFVWFIYIYYMVYQSKCISFKSNKTNIYLYSSFVVMLYLISVLLIYYGGCVRGLWGNK